MDKVTQCMVTFICTCPLLAACGAIPSTTSTATPNDQSTGPTVESTPTQRPLNPPTVKTATTSPTAGNPPENSLVITSNMNGKTFSLKVGDTFEIQLATSSMPGFEWTPEDPDTTILLQEGKAVL